MVLVFLDARMCEHLNGHVAVNKRNFFLLGCTGYREGKPAAAMLPPTGNINIGTLLFVVCGNMTFHSSSDPGLMRYLRSLVDRREALARVVSLPLLIC